MNCSLVYIERANSVKNVKLKIIQILMENGVIPDSIQISNQEFHFISTSEELAEPEHWCDKFNEQFKGAVEFKSKYPKFQLQA